MKPLNLYLNEGINENFIRSTFDRIKTNKMYKKTHADRFEKIQAPKYIVQGFNKMIKSDSFNLQEFKEYLVFVNNWRMEEVLKKHPKYRDDKNFQKEFMFNSDFDEDQTVQFLVGNYCVTIAVGRETQYSAYVEIDNYKNNGGGGMQWWLGTWPVYKQVPDHILEYPISFSGAFDADDYKLGPDEDGEEDTDIWEQDWVKKIVAAYKPFGDLAFGYLFAKNEKKSIKRLKDAFTILESMAR